MLQALKVRWAKHLKKIYPAIKSISLNRTDVYILIPLSKLIPFISFMRDSSLAQANQLVDIVVVDRPHLKSRFLITYCLLSTHYSTRYYVQILLKDLQPIETSAFVFNSANWLEREVWDMFGIYFTHHPDLRRILTDYGFDAHPLRKDFPVTGETALMYSDIRRDINYQPVKLSQEYRVFTLNKTWT